MSRRQSLDRPGILSPPGPFLTPSPSPSISASPRLQPSPSLSPFPQDVLLVTGNSLGHANTHEQERKTVTPGRRQSIHQFTNGSPNAGTVVFQPSPSQSPAAATGVIGLTSTGGGSTLNVLANFQNAVAQVAATSTATTLPTATTGNELNTTLVGSNNIQLNKKGNKRQQQQQQQQLQQQHLQQQQQLQQHQQQHHQIFSSSTNHYTTTSAVVHPSTSGSSSSSILAGGYGQSQTATTINNTPNTFASTNVASAPKNQTKKGTNPTNTVAQQQQQHHQQQQQAPPQYHQQQHFQQYHSNSPLIADSPSPSPSSTTITAASIKPPTPQPPTMQLLQQQFTIANNGNGGGGGGPSSGPPQQTFQLIQGPQGQIIAAAAAPHPHHQQRYTTTPTSVASSVAVASKSNKPPQQILPKPQQQQFADAQRTKGSGPNPTPTPPPPPVTSATPGSNMSQASLTQISQSATQPGQQQQQQQQQQQIILPSGATASLTTTAQQPLLLNQVPVLVQQNTPQGVQLILRPPTPQLTATPSLVIQNTRPQPQMQHQQQPQQVLRILGTNGATMQLATGTPTFIVSSQANLIQQASHLQTIKAQSQNPAITQLSGLHAALSAAAAANQQPRSQQFSTTAATLNGHLLGPTVAAQLQNLQLAAAAAAANGNSLTAQIQMPNGLSAASAPTTTTLLSQLPGAAQFQANSAQGLLNLNQLSNANIQQLAAAAVAAGATFHAPSNASAAASNNANGPNNGQSSNTTDLFSSNLTQSSPAHLSHTAPTPEPMRQPTPVLQNIPVASSQQTIGGGNAQIQLQINAAATIQMQQQQQQQQQQQIQQLQQQIQQTQNQVHQAQQQAQALQQQQHNQHQHQQMQQQQQFQQQQQLIQQQQLQHQQQQQQSQQHQPQPQQQQPAPPEPKKKSKPRKKKPPASSTSLLSTSASATTVGKPLTTTANKTLNTGTSTTSAVLSPAITSTSNTTTKIVPILSQQQQHHHQQSTRNLSNIQTSQMSAESSQQRPASPSPPPQITRASNGKLDLGNVMKLCGITEDDDDDFMDTTPIEENAHQDLNMMNSQDFTISIPQCNGTTESIPYTLSIPGISGGTSSGTTHSQNAETINMVSQDTQAAANIVIKIDPSEVGNMSSGSGNQPFSITIPRLPSQEEIQKQAQQHLNSQNESNQHHVKPFMSTHPTNITFSLPLSTTPALVSCASNSSNLTNSIMATSSLNAPQNSTTTPSPAASTTTTTTATVKPRRKPAAKRAAKKVDPAINVNNSHSLTSTLNSVAAAPTSVPGATPSIVTNGAISTPLPTPALVPSQIGNIQISQIDNRLGGNQQQVVPSNCMSAAGSFVENKIQIMPIVDSKSGLQQHNQLHTQLQTHLQPQAQIVYHANPNAVQQNHNIAVAQTQHAATVGPPPIGDNTQRQMQLVALPQLSNSSVASNASLHLSQPSITVQQSPGVSNHPTSLPHHQSGQSQMSSTVLPGISGNVSISVGAPNTIASLIPQLTGSLTLAVSEQCERLILRHDPNQPQDQQSQLILQALLKGALPNVTIINEPTKVEPKPQTTAAPLAPIPHHTATPQSITAMPSNVAAVPSVTTIAGNNKASKKTTNKLSAPSTATHVPNEVTKPPPSAVPVSHPINKVPENNMPGPKTNPNSSVTPSPNVNMPQQRYVALPKIDPTCQQLFCLNTLNNQITPIGANQTAASVAPTERLLIAPAGINAQQLAQCLQQGQIHFNDTNPLPPQPPPAIAATGPQMQPVQPMVTAGISIAPQQQQQPKQQIVYPMTSSSNATGIISTTSSTSCTTTTCSTAQSANTATITTTTTTTTTKQVANVAPIIDQSKAKQDNKLLGNSNTTSNASTGAVPKKKPVRKPKASTTTAADVALMKNASVVKPLPKLDPLSQKPNNNPVQIVQPNTASGKPVVSSATTSTTTSTSTNVVSIQPFQTQTSTGTKLVGVTAPMQQQPQPQQHNTLMQQQATRPQISNSFTINFSSSSITSSTTTPNITSFATGVNNSLTNGLPGVGGPNVSNHQPQHTVSRVQTIQLTPQQQQMFKQVQMQIQYLTVKMQHKNLLSSMPLPADLDPNVVAAFNKPMSDLEINQALQRLFMEQHRILAAGKEIPTSEQFITNAGNMTSTNTTSFNLIQTSATHNIAADNNKSISGISNAIPSNIVQPNNHSTLTGGMVNSTTGSGNQIASSNAGNSGQQQPQQQQPQQQQQQPAQQHQLQSQMQSTQKIHIYPIQHQQPPTKAKQQKANPQSNQQHQTQTQTQPQQQQQQQMQQQPLPPLSLSNSSSKVNTSATATTSTASAVLVTNKSKPNHTTSTPPALMNQSQNLPPTLISGPQLPQLSSLSSTSSLQFPSLPQPHMINIANMPAVLQQKHFTQHLQMQQQQLLQQQQQKIQISKVATPTAFASFSSNNSMAQSGPPPLIFPASSSASAITPTFTTTTMPQLASLGQQQFAASPNISATPTFNFTSIAGGGLGNQKQFIISTSSVPSLPPSSTTCLLPSSTPSAIIANNASHSQHQQTISMAIASSVPLANTATIATSSIAMPQLVMATPHTITTPSSQSGTMASVIPSSSITSSSLSSSCGPTNANNNIVVQNAILNASVGIVGSGLNVVGNPMNQLASIVKLEDKVPSKAKLARLSLFLQQLEADQNCILNPDYKHPFQNKEEAVKRLIRYHCMYQNDEDVPSEEEEEFELTATRFQDKFRKLSGKFQQILLQESMLQHRTSEICQMEKLMIDDLRQEIADSRKLEQDIIKYEEQCQKEEYHVEQTKDDCGMQTSSLFDKIKSEIKNDEIQDTKLSLDMIHSNNDSNSNFCSNLQNTTSSFESIKNEIKVESFDNSLASTTGGGGKSCSSSMDSFDLLKQSSMASNNMNMAKKSDEIKDSKKEDSIPSEIVSQWNHEVYADTKSTNNFYNHLPESAAVTSLPKNAAHLFNGTVSKSSPPGTPTPVEQKKDNFENFDIESEITPTFIMKKVENKEAQQPTSETKTVAAAITSATSISTATSVGTTAHFNKKIKTSTVNVLNSVVNSKSDIVQHQPSHIGPLASATKIHHEANQNLPSNAQPEVLPNSFDFSHHLSANQSSSNKHQDDDWLCIQKELNLMNTADNTSANKNSDSQNKSLDFLTAASSEDLFTNSCMEKTLQPQQQHSASQHLPKSTCNLSDMHCSCSQQNQQPLALQLNNQHEDSRHADLNEFFSGSDEDNSEVHKAVENRLESMFGESPVHLSGSKERLDSPDDLDSIFGETAKSSSNLPCSEFATNTFITTSAAPQHAQGDYISATNNMAHHIQLGSSNNPRWMQNMEAQFPDFLTTSNADCMSSRKRQWNGHLVDESQQHQEQQPQMQQEEESPQKKMCPSLTSNAAMNDSSASSTSPQQQQQHHMVTNDTSHAQDLMDAALLSLHDGLGVETTATDTTAQSNGYAHMVMTPSNFPNFNNQLEGQQPQQQSHFLNVHQQQQNLSTSHMMHHMNHHGHHHPGTTATGSGEFDDDITRHVQNAIDSILNLQSSEADSLSFSLDHSMGALLGETILNDNQSANNVSHEAAKRRQLVDELGDCLMGGGNSSTDASNLTDGHLLMDNTTAAHQQPQHQHHNALINHNNLHHISNNTQQQGQQQQPQLNDFNCVVGTIDEAVKSIMTS